MARIATLLDTDAKKRVGTALLVRAETLILEAADRDAARGIREAICDALKQPSLNRLRAYSRGTYFPTPQVLRKLAGALGLNYLLLLAWAGYDREVITAVHALRVVGRKRVYRDCSRRAVEYAIAFFPRRGERYIEGSGAFSAFSHAIRQQNTYQAALHRYPAPADDEIDLADRRVPLAGPLARAFDILGDNKLEVECRRAIAGELVRSWAYAVNETLARSVVESTYARAIAVGEHAIPFLPIGSLARAVNPTRRQP